MGQCGDLDTPGYKCFCNLGWEGELCDREINECESMPCLNGGQCIDQIAGYMCTCLPGKWRNRERGKVFILISNQIPSIKSFIINQFLSKISTRLDDIGGDAPFVWFLQLYL